MEDEILRLISLQSSLITDVPLEIPFSVENDSMLPQGVKMDSITIHPLKVGTVLRISPLIARIDKKDFEKITVSKDQKYDPGIQGPIEKYSEIILEIICLGIHNRKSPYPDYLKEFLKENCTWEDLHIILNGILFRMGAMSFINSTTALTSVGLMDAAEIIALQKNLERWGTNPSAPSPSSRSQTKPSGGARVTRSGE
jgi:hypothetical protein